MKKFKIKKSVIIIIAIAAIILVAFMWPRAPVTMTVSTFSLESGELTNSVSVKGGVESTEKKQVYSSLTFPVESVNVKVGDEVTVGQVLCQLDTEDLSLTIAQQKAELNKSQESNLNQLNNNQRIYNEAVSGISKGTNQQVLSAENAVKTSAENLKNAQRNYDDKLKEQTEHTNAQILSAENALSTAELDMNTKYDTYMNNKILLEAGALSQTVYTNSETAYTAAKNQYDNAVTTLENAKRTLDNSLKDLKAALDTAQLNYNNAVASLASVNVTAEQDLEKYRNSITSSQIAVSNDSQLIAIQKLEKQFADSTITAPVSGTVTAVYAKEGAPGSGLMFVIEKTNDLKIITQVKEYDSGRIKIGMPVIIKSDATGDDEYEGEITKIAPTSVKNAAGDSANMSDVLFETEVSVTSKETDLKIGMNARMTVVLEKKENVFFLPYDAIGYDADGATIVYTLTESTGGKYLTSAIPVSPGMETDFYTEISGEGLSNGILIVSDAATVTNNQEVLPQQ